MNRLSDVDLQKALKKHKRWVESLGKSGQQFLHYDTDFSDCDFSGQNMCEAWMNGGCIDRAYLRHTDLYASLIAGSSFRGACLTEVILTKANADYTCFAYADLRGAKLVKTKFYEADLQYANLAGADMGGAWLYQTNLTFARLNGADLSRASLNETRLYNADLRGIIGLDTAYITSIDIGAEGSPQILEAEEAKAWLMQQQSMADKARRRRANLYVNARSYVSLREGNLIEAELTLAENSSAYFAHPCPTITPSYNP